MFKTKGKTFSKWILGLIAVLAIGISFSFPETAQAYRGRYWRAPYRYGYYYRAPYRPRLYRYNYYGYPRYYYSYRFPYYRYGYYW